MPLSQEDRHAIKVIYQEKGWSARKICSEFPSRQWKITTVHDLIKKIDATGSSDRLQGSGRPRTAMTEENLAFVLERSVSTGNRPGTSSSERQMASELGVSQPSVHRMKRKQNIHTFTRIVTPRMSADAKQRRSDRAHELHQAITPEDIPNLVFYDEKDLTLQTPINRQTNKVCGVGVLKKDVSPDRLFHCTSRFSKKIMVCGAICYRGLSKLIVVDPQKVKVDSAHYQQVLKQLLPSISKLYGEDEEWIWVQDSAPSHRSASTQEFLMDNTPSFIPHDAWPPHSPDCNPLDYQIWNELKEKVYAGRSEPFANVEELSAAAKKAWKEIPLDHLRVSIDRFKSRLETVVDQEGGPIQHLMR
jgi:transposase